jgi:hypothetical protein
MGKVSLSIEAGEFTHPSHPRKTFSTHLAEADDGRVMKKA